MPRIRQLPPTLVNQIAAGEVIERPGSVVKELLENAVDAGATRMDVAVEQGGRDFIRVRDNGGGILADDLALAVASHATSKIEQLDDLFRVRTLGFRGEALASIAAVSQLRLRSRPSDQTAGAEIEVAGGQAGEVRAWGGPAGTIVEVRHLFFNTPARRKFLRTTQTEMGHIVEAFTRVALAYPRIHLTLQHNDRLVYELPATERWVERLQLFFGRSLAESLMWVESEDGPTRLWGYVADPSQSRPNPRWQYLFLNGRAIRDRALSHALGEAYRGLLMTGRYPIAFLYLEMPPELVDVNVHPTKMEVRFQEAGRLYNQVLATLRTRFLTSDLKARLKAPNDAPAVAASADVPDPSEGRRQVAQWAVSQLTARQAEPELVAADMQDSDVAFERPPLGVSRFAEPVAPNETHAAPRDQQWPVRPSANSQEPQARLRPSDPTLPLRALQLHNAYLVAETPDGMVVIDQHALHERILYEELRQRLLQRPPECQRLLVPEVVDLAAAEAAMVLEHQPLLAQLGIDVEPFGGASVLVKAYPAMLTNLSPHELLRDVVDQLQSKSSPSLGRRDLLDELLHMVACRAAIKAGQRLQPPEIAALLERADLAQDSHHCPHGRPTALVFTKEDLDKQFKRV